MSNFGFLREISEYAMFAPAAVEAERVYASAAGSRRCPASSPRRRKNIEEAVAFAPEDISEFKTRKIYIDVDLRQMGWKLAGAGQAGQGRL